ncbi:unnamed protein product, partial [Scytosiphon promiscuus]
RSYTNSGGAKRKGQLSFNRLSFQLHTAKKGIFCLDLVSMPVRRRQVADWNAQTPPAAYMGL